MPSKAGAGFLSVVVLLWLTGTNYENNLILGLAFFLTALFVVCIYHTFFNMSGLLIEAIKSSPCFVGDDGELEMQLSSPSALKRPVARENIQLSFAADQAITVDLIEHSTVTVKLFVKTLERGWYQPPRLKVESHFPLGIVRCWSWLVIDQPILVYPKPIAGGELPVVPAAGQDGERLADPGAEDFDGFKRYQLGASPRHIAWKHYARGQGLFTKEYSSYREPRVWLDWDALEGLGQESRLSRLCYWALKLSATQQPYGLRLPGVSVAPSTGLEHKQRVLKALALFGRGAGRGAGKDTGV